MSFEGSPAAGYRRNSLCHRSLIAASLLFGILSIASGQQPEDELILLAEYQEQIAEGHQRAQGYVDIRSGDIRLQADEVEYWSEEMRVVAHGNVVFQQGDQKIVATDMEADLNTSTGKFYNAYGVAGADLFFYGDVIEKESEDVYVIERGAFTSCAQPNPRWRFTSGKARIRRDHHVLLHNAFLKVKSLPVFYLPIFYYPINEEGRSTGFLMPNIGNSSLKGFTVSESFFWAINRSMDATFTYDYFSIAGNGGGAEYRYVASDVSRGEVMTYFIKDRTTGSQEYSVNANANQMLPGDFRAIARVDFFSSFDFQQRFTESYDRATQRSKRASGTISRSFKQYNLRVLMDRNDTSFGDRVAVRQILPRFSLNSRPSKIGSTPILFSFDSEASSLSRTSSDVQYDYQRFDVVPTVSYPFTGLSWMTFRTSLTGRYTYYTAAVDESGIIDDSRTTDRRYYELSFDTRGPTFARIFNTPDNGYAARWKHVIEPQMVWSYRSRVDEFDEIPKFDGNDYVPGTNEISLSIVNRLFAKRVVNGEEQTTPTEALSWVVSQRYFFNAEASLYDSQFSTPYFTADGTPSNYSPITSRLRFRPSRRISASWNLDYDLSFHAIRSSSLAGTYMGERWGSVTALWSRRNIVDRDVVRSNFRGNFRYNISAGLQTSFDASYDATNKRLQHMRAGVNYNVQCCGFMFEYSRFNFGSSVRNENLFRFGITLANVGTFGTFLGSQAR